MVDSATQGHELHVSEILPATATIGIARFHVQAGRLEWDARASTIFAATGDRPTLDIWRDRVHPADRHLVQALYHDPRASAGVECVYRIRLPDGTVRRILTRSVSIEMTADGEPALLTGVVFVIDSDADSHDLLIDVLDTVSVGFAVLDEHMIVRYVNAQSERHLGISRANVVGRHIHEALPATKGSYFDSLHREVVRTRTEVKVQVRSIFSAGMILEVTANYVDGAVAIDFRDVTSATKTTQRLLGDYRNLLTKSRLDDLTGVLNRAALLERISRLSEETAAPAALLFIDIDDFKAINDRHGHLDGDLVLRITAQRLAAQCDDDTVIGRIGGDEFVAAIFADCTLDRTPLADKLVNRMHDAAGEPISISNSDVTISISIGVASNNSGSTLEELLTAADSDLYRVKAASKDCRH